jgi:hypothetical protein
MHQKENPAPVLGELLQGALLLYGRAKVLSGSVSLNRDRPR